MLKYIDAVIGLAEVPSEISLCISFSNCKIHCPNCHSKYLWEDVGEYLTFDKLNELIVKNDGITCICLMGQGNSTLTINDYAKFIKDNYPYKVAWYTGLDYIPTNINIDFFDYIKLGKYVRGYGGLDSPTTNQRMYKIENITHEFQRNKS